MTTKLLDGSAEFMGPAAERSIRLTDNNGELHGCCGAEAQSDNQTARYQCNFQEAGCGAELAVDDQAGNADWRGPAAGQRHTMIT